MKKILFFISFLFSIALNAQDHPHEVNDMIQQNEWLKAHPELHDEVDRLEQQLELELEHYLKHSAAKRGEQYLIPVVFHVLHTNGAENISDEQIEDAVEILTRDFNFQNPDTADIVPQFKPIAGNPEISFRLAKIDPTGNPTSGITRTFTELSNDAGENSKIISWPRDKYLNIWVVNSIASGAAGYTFYPSSAQFFPSRDGIIILHNYVGSIGTGSARRSRALTHEVGHWINLPHVWGSTNSPELASNCNSDDGVSDTPLTIGWRSCNLNGETCGSLDNVQNYMDYSYCYAMFTKGQSDRMRAALTSSVAERSSLITAENHRETGIKEHLQARWKPNKTVICEGEAVVFTDRSNYDQSSWDWSFEGATPQMSTDTNPRVTYLNEGQYNVSLEVGDGVRNASNTELGQIYVLPKQGFYTPYTETFENPLYTAQLWTTRNADIQNAYGWEYSGNGSYEGKYSLVNRNYASEAGRVDEFISSTMDWSSFEQAIVDFKLAFRQRAQDNNDKLRIYVSNDCGATWKLRWVKTGVDLATGQPTGAFFIPSKSDWVEVEINNFPAEDMVDNVILKFVFESGGGNELYIDNLLIAGKYKSVPVLNFPKDGQNNVSENAKIDWKPIFGVSGYEYEIDTDTSFSSTELQTAFIDYISVDPFGEDSEASIQLDRGKTYYWRVRSYFNSEISDWSETWSFDVSPTGDGDTLEIREMPDLTIGLGELQQEFDVRVFPNPSRQGSPVMIKMEKARSGQIEIRNSLGQLMHVQGFNKTPTIEIDGQFMSKGLFWLTIKSDELNHNQTILIE